ncbi:MAG: glycosyltransferase [Bacteroidetes bacterium]|jgi:glycosyltransferase involved in cell wall biosynthesis|nr:glycosyltransferase [Chloroflexota bacterium]MBT6834774.1 glycosyltransferase [Bacteroidota bacterium]MBT4002503.1 glycosyltransferase [Chloroflexota bacterium]MBT4306210.1 glycosyltransferase [Chloroflexota bacterium]MBT4535001.1 glycosyltransferase [Chloroflexota bacterium]
MKKISKKIIFFIPTLEGGGAERVFLNLAREFIGLGHSVDIVLKEKTGELLPLVPQEIRIISLKSSRMFATLIPLINYLKKEKPDILISGLELPNTIASLASLLTNLETTFILTFHSIISELSISSPKRNIEKGFARLLYPVADQYVAVSKAVAKDIVQFYRLPSEKINVIYNPVPVQEIQKLAKEPVDHPFYQSGSPIILGIGRLVSGKNFDILINAFSQLQGNHNAKLIILGEGEMRTSLEMLIEDLDIKKDVALIGFEKNPYKFLSKAKVFVHTSSTEGFGLVLVEALAAGCPVISVNNSGGTLEVLDYGKYGRMVPTGNIEKLTKTIGSIIMNSKKETKIYDWLNQFSPEIIAKKYLKLK